MMAKPPPPRGPFGPPPPPPPGGVRMPRFTQSLRDTARGQAWCPNRDRNHTTASPSDDRRDTLVTGPGPGLCRACGQLEPRRGTGVPLVCARLDDLCQLGDGMTQLVLAVEEVRAEPDARIGTKVADDPALAELTMDGGVIGRAHDHGAAATRVLARAHDLEAGAVEQLDEQSGERERPLADPLDADLFDHVVARGRRVQRRHVRRAGEEARDTRGVLELRFEVERPRMALPADERRLRRRGEIMADVEAARAGPAAGPLDAAADGAVDAECGEV